MLLEFNLTVALSHIVLPEAFIDAKNDVILVLDIFFAVPNSDAFAEVSLVNTVAFEVFISAKTVRAAIVYYSSVSELFCPDNPISV